MPGNQKSVFFENFTWWMNHFLGIKINSIADYICKNTKKVILTSVITYVFLKVSYQNFRDWKNGTHLEKG